MPLRIAELPFFAAQRKYAGLRMGSVGFVFLDAKGIVSAPEKGCDYDLSHDNLTSQLLC